MADSQARILSINIGRAERSAHTSAPDTGIFKKPINGVVTIAAPEGRTSGVVGDHIGDPRHHGGENQAVYAFAREDLDRWEQIKDRSFANGAFGENLTTTGIDVNDARIGERWRIGDEVVLEVTGPRIPCRTFRGVISEPKWIREFTQDARPGVYFKVITPGTIQADDAIDVISRPDHDITVSLVFRATTTDKSLLPLLKAHSDELDAELIDYAENGKPDTDPL